MEVGRRGVGGGGEGVRRQVFSILAPKMASELHLELYFAR